MDGKLRENCRVSCISFILLFRINTCMYAFQVFSWQFTLQICLFTIYFVFAFNTVVVIIIMLVFPHKWSQSPKTLLLNTCQVQRVLQTEVMCLFLCLDVFISRVRFRFKIIHNFTYLWMCSSRECNFGIDLQKIWNVIILKFYFNEQATDSTCLISSKKERIERNNLTKIYYLIKS